MIAREVNVFLTRAALLDPRMKRVDPDEQANMAIAWAEVLDDVALDAALIVLRAHYRESSDPITPAIVTARVGVSTDEDRYESIDDRVQARLRLDALAAAGVTEEEFRAHEHDVAWLRAKFATKGVER